MNIRPNNILLVDDDNDDNFFHERAIKNAGLGIVVVTKDKGYEALEYLKSKNNPQTDLIFLDINMPGMSGWEFLEEYKLLDKKIQDQAIIIMLTTSDSSVEVAKARAYTFVHDYITKPLTKEMVKEVHKYFE